MVVTNGFDGDIQIFRQPFYFALADPDEAGLTGAAVPALRAGELQAVGVPGVGQDIQFHDGTRKIPQKP